MDDEPALIEDAELELGHMDGHDLAGMGEPDLDAFTGGPFRRWWPHPEEPRTLVACTASVTRYSA